MPQLTLWSLQASRSIRTVWLLEELGLEYELKCFDRMPDMKAPEEFKQSCGNPLGKAPTLRDGEVTVYESGAITEYLCEKFDKEGRLLPRDYGKERVRVLQWIHASEATFMLHALAITYARWTMPEHAQKLGVLEAMEKAMSVNVQKDLDWLESELTKSGGKFLCGETVTAADVMMHFSVDYIVRMKVGTQGKRWEAIERWLERCAEVGSYKRAVQKTGHRLP